jgi:2-haloalkanoic acid dehalogenase type II
MNVLADVDAVIFDLDDTLWDVGPVILRAEHAMMSFLAERYPRVVRRHTLETMRDVRARMAIEHANMRHDFTWLRLRALELHALEAGYPVAMAGEAFEVFYRARNEVAVYEDVVPALVRLARKFRLFAVSNGNADLRSIGLAAHFERSLAAREAGMAKPDARIFEMLLGAARVRPERAVHVGDDPHADVEGARRAGIRAVWVNRGQAAWPADLPAPDYSVGSLSELVTLLDAGA